MDHKYVYNQIIENRKLNLLEETEYGEWHHIIPKSLGGTDEAENLVRLTAREHFICHALLAEMYEPETLEWYKMNHAFMMMKADSMAHNGNRYINARLYELKRKEFSIVMSVSQTGEKNSQYGKIWIHNLELEQSIPIVKNELNKYLKYGWKVGRIVNFYVYKQKLINKERKKNNYLKNKEAEFQNKVDYYTELYNQFIKSECVSLRSFHKKIKYPYVVGALSKNFTKYVKEYNPTKRKSYKE